MAETTPDTRGWVRIEVRAPLPMDMAGTIMQLIGTAYPSARIDTRAGFDTAIAMLVDPHERARRVTKKDARALRARNEAGGDDIEGAQFQGFDGDSLLITPPSELQLFLGEIAHRIFTGYEEDAGEPLLNYLEWQVATPAGDGYVLCVARSKQQTPHALRERAERDLSRAQAARDRAESDLEHARAENAHLRALLAEVDHRARIPDPDLHARIQDAVGIPF